MNDAIKFINEKFEESEADRKEKEREIAKLKSTSRALDRHEQYSRRNVY